MIFDDFLIFFEHTSKGIFMFLINLGEFRYFLNIIFSFAPEKSGHFNIMKKNQKNNLNKVVLMKKGKINLIKYYNKKKIE